jgi:hypothetical protein
MNKTPEDVLISIYQHVILKVDDLAVVILKGHLIIEDLLLDLLAARAFRDRKALQAADLKFFQKVQLCRALVAFPALDTLWELIHKLNTLRNDLGHSLDAPKRKSLLADIRHGYNQLTAAAPDIRMEEMASDESLLGMVAAVLLAVANPNQAPPALDAFVKNLQGGKPAAN